MITITRIFVAIQAACLLLKIDKSIESEYSEIFWPYWIYFVLLMGIWLSSFILTTVKCCLLYSRKSSRVEGSMILIYSICKFMHNDYSNCTYSLISDDCNLSWAFFEGLSISEWDTNYYSFRDYLLHDMFSTYLNLPGFISVGKRINVGLQLDSWLLRKRIIVYSLNLLFKIGESFL